jgi:hypothetical protein
LTTIDKQEEKWKWILNQIDISHLFLYLQRKYSKYNILSSRI